MSARSILFVCVGNICRSPMAEAWARKRFGQVHRVESAGIAGLTGEKAARNAILVSREQGLDLDAHRARHVREIDLESYDLIVPLSSGIARHIREDYGVSQEKIRELDIDDPYGSGIESFRDCLDEITRQIEHLSKDVWKS